MSHTYPAIQPYTSEMLDVGQGHQLYLEQTGNPNGIPLVYLHGGPGAGLAPIYRSLFDPQKYRIIGFDQRGCGRSTPFVSLEHNHTEALLEDIQTIRRHLGISSWVVCGGSWGSTLALLTAIQHPKTVSALILRGIFLARKEDVDWFLGPQGGAAQLFPEYYERFVAQVNSPDTPDALLEAFYKVFTQGDEISKLAAAKAWCLWEERISCLNSSVNEQDLLQELHRVSSLAILECHFIRQQCFIDENYILDNIQALSNIPGTIIHGRYDIVCKMQAAHALRQHWPNSQLLIVPESGHSASEPRVAEAICHASDAMARFLLEDNK